ncbi:hypothetical protein BACI9J_60261 [Bacillus altitudinis]|nr:hypothetical protein BACI9J_60261 [Bacillus altitudinis]
MGKSRTETSLNKRRSLAIPLTSPFDMYQHFPGHHLPTVTAYASLSILKLKKEYP